MSDPFWNYVVLGCAFVFEGISWFFGWQALRSAKGRRSIIEAIHESKDPTNFIVIFEDSGALIGLLIALAGVYFGHRLNIPALDGVASILIGLVLSLIAIFLAYESKGLLIGEGVERETLRRLRKLIQADPAVERLNYLLTMYFGPHEVMLALDVRFDRRLTVAELRTVIARLKQSVRKMQPDITRIYFAAEAISEEEEQEALAGAGQANNLRA